MKNLSRRALGLLAFAQFALAGSAAANGREPASLLLYPEFDNRHGIATVLTVTNSSRESEVDVEFIYIAARNGEYRIPCMEFNRTENLTPNDTLSVLTVTHNPQSFQGYVYVFAKDSADNKIKFNHLIGQQLVVDGLEEFQYSVNPFAFLAIVDDSPDGSFTDIDLDGQIDLNGKEYEMAPDEIFVPRFIGQDSYNQEYSRFRGDLVLVDLTGTEFYTTINFLAFNDDEDPFSAQVTFKCWTKVALTEISNLFLDDFLKNSTGHDYHESLGGREYGWFKMDGNIANSSATSITDPAFLAYYIERVNETSAADLPFEGGEQANGDLLWMGVQGDLVTMNPDDSGDDSGN